MTTTNTTKGQRSTGDAATSRDTATAELGSKPEETLDPGDWSSLRTLGHEMLDDMFSYLEKIRSAPAWQPVPDHIKATFAAPVPRAPLPAREVYERFAKEVLPYPTGNIHPRFWGWVMGTGSPFAMLADMLASGMNPHVAGYDQAAFHVEKQVIAWLGQLLGLPENSSGVLVSGGSMANLIGLVVARQAKSGTDGRGKGLRDAPKQMTVYCSLETHSWAQKAVELMGIGSEHLRRVEVNDRFQINLRELERAIRTDRENGFAPICVIGSAGTVNTGATDDLMGLRQLCDAEELWFHVDGAFGALAGLSSKYRHLVNGLNSADSIAVDLHKWMYMPFEAGCVFVRDAALHRQTFSVTPNYLSSFTRGIASQPMEFAALGVDLSRGFRALKIWMSLQMEGSEKFGRLIEQNIDQAQYLASLISQHPHLEVLAPVELNVVCFRYVPVSDADESELTRINSEILLELQESGVAVVSSTLVNGRFALRAAITNHRSRRSDFDLLIDAVVKIGAGAVLTARQAS